MSEQAGGGGQPTYLDWDPADDLAEALLEQAYADLEDYGLR